MTNATIDKLQEFLFELEQFLIYGYRKPLIEKIEELKLQLGNERKQDANK